MKKQKNLLLARNMFAFIIFVIFGVIVVTEKSKGLLIPKITERMNDYFDKNYSSIKEEITMENVLYKNNIYSMKIISQKNKHLYFYIKGTNKKFFDTYKQDYLEGKTLFTYLKNELE